MIKIFKPTDTSFTSNGDVVVQATRAVVHKEDNGEFYLEIEAPVDYADFFEARNIIVADTPQGEQAFRLGDDIQTTHTKIKAKAKHVFYDGLNLLVTEANIENLSCAQALALLNQNTDSPSPFSVFSDVEKIDTQYFSKVSFTEAVNTVLNEWGGHLVRDNFLLGIKTHIGRDLGVTIQYRKNLKEIVRTENWSGVCTKLLPVGKDNVMLDSVFMYSTVQYDTPFTRSVLFSQNINREDYETEEAYIAALKADLYAQGEEYLSKAQYPSINYTITANPEKIMDVGDTVAVYDERIGVELLASVLSYDYDAILGQYNQVQFGTATPSLSNLMTSINSTINNSIDMSLANVTDYVNAEIDSLSEDLTEYIEDELTFSSGETISVSGIVESGYIDSTAKVIKFTVQLHKDTQDREVTLTSLKLNGFAINGSIFSSYSSSGFDVLNASGYSVSTDTDKNAITIAVTRSAGFQITPLTPISIEVVDLGITFG